MEMIYFPHQPSEQLAGSVESIFYLGHYSPEHEIERIVPDGSINLVIELDNQDRHVLNNKDNSEQQLCRAAWVSGLHKQYLTITAPTDTHLMAVRFLPWGAYPQVKADMTALTDQVIPATQLFGASIEALRQKLLDEPDPEEKCLLLESWLVSNLDQEYQPNPAIIEAASTIMVQPDVHLIQTLIENSGYSKKQFIHLFKKHIGVTPKYLQRIYKFNEIIASIHQKKEVHWVEVSHACGYFDQSHLIRDFKHFSGYKPEMFLGKGHDRLNFFPQDEEV